VVHMSFTAGCWWIHLVKQGMHDLMMLNPLNMVVQLMWGMPVSVLFDGCYGTWHSYCNTKTLCIRLFLCHYWIFQQRHGSQCQLLNNDNLQSGVRESLYTVPKHWVAASTRSHQKGCSSALTSVRTMMGVTMAVITSQPVFHVSPNYF
jgi:hypothetical protein